MYLPRTALRVALGLFVVWALVAGARVETLRIRSPRLGRPFIGTGMEEFEAVLDARGVVPARGWEWALTREGMDPILLSASEGKGSMFGRSFQLTLPPVSPTGKYTLEASRGDRTLRSDAAIFVVTDWPERWTVVQAADLPRLGVEDEGARFRHFLDVVRQLDPQAMLLTGDILYIGGEERYQSLIAGLEELSFPVIVAPGNHEREDWSSYLRHFPDSVHVVDLGPFRVISLDSGSERDQLTLTQLAWLQRELEEAPDRPSLIQIHHPLFGWDSILRRRARFLDLVRRGSVAAVLSGHTHWDDFHGPDGKRFEGGALPPQPWFIMTTTAGVKTIASPISGEEVAGVRVLEFEGDRLVQGGYRKTPTAVPTCTPLNFPAALLPR